MMQLNRRVFALKITALAFGSGLTCIPKSGLYFGIHNHFGTGKGKTGGVVKMLAQENFGGLVAIEYEEGEDPQEDVEKCVKFVLSKE